MYTRIIIWTVQIIGIDSPYLEYFCDGPISWAFLHKNFIRANLTFNWARLKLCKLTALIYYK